MAGPSKASIVGLGVISGVETAVRDVGARFLSRLRTSGWKVQHQEASWDVDALRAGVGCHWTGKIRGRFPVLIFAWSVAFPIRKGPVADEVELTQGIFGMGASPL